MKVWPANPSAPVAARLRFDAKGANLVEYTIAVGVVALVALLGFRAFGSSVRMKVTAEAACVGSLDGNCSRAPSGVLAGAPTPAEPFRFAAAPTPTGTGTPSAAPAASRAPTRPLPADKQVSDPALRAIDAKLTAMFTDTGFVRAASSDRNVSYAPDRSPMDSHYQLKDGKLHTIHIFANESADSDNANVYLPKAFSDVTITSKDTVVAKNPTTGEVILIAHVQVGAGSQGMKTLRENMKTVRPNGTVLIGKIGGEGGGDGDYVHSHLSIFPSEAARLRATAYKKKNWEYTSETSANLADFRDLIK